MYDFFKNPFGSIFGLFFWLISILLNGPPAARSTRCARPATSTTRSSWWSWTPPTESCSPCTTPTPTSSTCAARSVHGHQGPEFKFRFVFFPLQMLRFSQLSADRFGKNVEGVMTLSQVKSSQNFCSFGPQRVEKRII